MRRVCSMCGKEKPGAMVGGTWLCDDDLNSPKRTRGGNAPAAVPQPEREKPTVAMNKIVLREDDEDGAVIKPVADTVLAPPSAAEIAAKKLETITDPKYVPTNSRTLARMGLELIGDAEGLSERGGTAAEAAGPVVQSAGKPARSAPKPNAQRFKSRRNHKTR